MTIKDVAAYCGVAVSTVSRVLNNHPDVSPETRTRVLEAVDKLHYIPNNSARDLVLATADTIGLVVRGAENPFYTPIIRTIEERCEEAGYTMVLHQIPVGADEISAGATLVRSKRLKGLIFLGGRFDYSRAERDAIGIPFVCCTNTNQFGDLDKSVYSSLPCGICIEVRRGKSDECSRRGCGILLMVCCFRKHPKDLREDARS